MNEEKKIQELNELPFMNSMVSDSSKHEFWHSSSSWNHYLLAFC